MHLSVYSAVRLTAIDTTLALANSGHVGKIFMGSRGGLLPNVIGQSQPYECQYIKLEKIPHNIERNVLLELFWAEIEHAEGRKINSNTILHPPSSPIAFLEKEISYVKSTIRPWQSVLASIYPIVPYLWNRLNEKGKSTFLQEYYSIWLTYVASFPRENAQKILNLLKNSKISTRFF